MIVSGLTKATHHPVRFAEREPLLELYFQDAAGCSSPQPVTVGVPFSKGRLAPTDPLELLDSTGQVVPLQTRSLARWSDGSVKWLLLDFTLAPSMEDISQWMLCRAPQATADVSPLRVQETPQEIVVETGVATFRVSRTVLRPLDAIAMDGRDLLDPDRSAILLCDAQGRSAHGRIEHSCIEEQGPVRVTVRLEGTFDGTARCRFVARTSFFAGLALVRLALTLHNPQRARHPGGIWDLGDPGSILFRDLSVQLALRETTRPRITWQAEPGLPCRSADGGGFEIYQDSSGGENWQSVNHVNAAGRVPCSFRGYRVRSQGHEENGLRASPVLSLQGGIGGVTAALPNFWQQFPKALEVNDGTLCVRLFPQQFGDPFELQGGEQKTHTVWLQFHTGTTDPTRSLDWVHRPARVLASPEWYAASGALAPFTSPEATAATPLEELLHAAVAGPKRLAARREVIDEYGWRHYGEIYADHEEAYYSGPKPVVSHYNNQYDGIYGTLLHYLRSGDAAWLELCEPLARHVIDIDIYHTDRDKAAYNGGLFWFTDHYKTAATCTHRTYSRANCKPGDRSYGGGPASAHNFSTGLLHYYFLTGNPDARAAVISLANWVLAMDDGRRNVLGLVDDGPTGLASATFVPDYQGPGRGCGNSINALLDAWILTGTRAYLDYAETLLRRCIHPADNVAARDLLNVELRWSYTVFLSVLAKYLRLKAECDELDAGYAYARASLLHYARWMVDNEIAYFDQADKLEFPTEAWAAQELRKANVLRLAAEHADEPLRSRLRSRGDELADRGWRDLMRFESRTLARALAIVFVEGMQDLCCRVQQHTAARPAIAHQDFGEPTQFIPQKRRALQQLRSLRGLCRLALRLMNPANWPLRRSQPLDTSE